MSVKRMCWDINQMPLEKLGNWGDERGELRGNYENAIEKRRWKSWATALIYRVYALGGWRWDGDTPNENQKEDQI
jgi:hypothetical protein